MKKLLLILCAGPLFAAGPLDWGVKFGVPFNDAVKAAGEFKSNFSRWTLGPTVDINLPAGLGIEGDILFRRTGYSLTASNMANSFEFPLLLKYKFPGNQVARVYVSGGLAFRHISDIPRLLDADSKGAVLGLGMQYNLKVLKISPEFRYTRWDNQPLRLTNLHSAQNQAEVLVGITF